MTAEAGEATAHFDVCVITTIHPDFDKRVFRQISSFADAGLKTCVVAPWDFTKRQRTDFSFVATPVPRSRAQRLRHSWRTYRAARAVSAAVYIFHDPDFLPFALPLRRATGAAVVFDCHENLPEDIRYGKDWIPPALRAPISAVYRRFENHVVRRLGRAIVTVPNLSRRFSALGAEVIEVRNYPRLTVPPGFVNDRAVLYTGTLSRDYGAETILQIAAEMRRRNLDVPLRVVDLFGGDTVFRDNFLARVASENLPIEVLAPVPSDRMPEILARGAIGISPILNTPNKALALPTKIFEYYKFGIVVVASDVEGSRIATRDGALGLLAPHDDVSGWVDAIERLLRDDNLLQSIRAAGLKAAEDEFNWDGEAQRMIAFVRRIIPEYQ